MTGTIVSCGKWLLKTYQCLLRLFHIPCVSGGVALVYAPLPFFRPETFTGLKRKWSPALALHLSWLGIFSGISHRLRIASYFAIRGLIGTCKDVYVTMMLRLHFNDH